MIFITLIFNGQNITLDSIEFVNIQYDIQV
jgi:hypothetical protein